MTTTDPQIPGYVAGTWTIDAVHPHVGFVIKHMMVSKVRGRFGTFSGTIEAGVDPLASSVSVSIDARSVDTSNSTRDEHVRSADFFGVDEHPTIDFTSTGFRRDGESFLADGELTIRGVTKPVTLTMDTPEFARTAQGGTKAGFSATTQIYRTDFGVNYNGPIPGGGVALGEKAQIVLELEADLVPGSTG